MKRSGGIYIVLVGVGALYPFSACQGGYEDRVPLEALQKSRAADLFKDRKYDDAYLEFQKLSQDYPKDPLPRRYMGMSRALQGRVDDAIQIYQDAIKLDPNNVAPHYYLARSYLQKKQYDLAEAELKRVVALGRPEGIYRRSAEKALETTRKARQKMGVMKEWSLSGSLGYEYDSNVTFEPQDKGLQTPDDQNAGRYYLSLYGTRDVYRDSQWLHQLTYGGYQSFHDDRLNAYNYMFHELGWMVRRSFLWFGKKASWQMKYTFPIGFLHGDLFYFSNQLRSSLTVWLNQRQRVMLYHRSGFREFGPDGSEPLISSRDGYYNATGIRSRWYSETMRHYFFTGYEFQNADTRGKNYDVAANLISVGVGFKLNEALALNVSASHNFTNYYHFTSEPFLDEPLARRGNNTSVMVSLVHTMSEHWSQRIYYTYADYDNRNDDYQYHQHLLGVETTYEF